MSYCVAINCSRKDTKGNRAAGITFHKFPLKNPKILQKWLQKMRRYEYTPSKSDVVCSTHFEPHLFHKGERTRLLPNAVPTIFDFPKYLQQKEDLCAVVGCTNRKSRCTTKSFHKFPKIPVLFKKWARRVGREANGKLWLPGCRTVICSDHFRPEDFSNPESEVSHRKLHKFVVPSVFPEIYENDDGKVHDDVNLANGDGDNCVGIDYNDGIGYNDGNDVGIDYNDGNDVGIDRNDGSDVGIGHNDGNEDHSVKQDQTARDAKDSRGPFIAAKWTDIVEINEQVLKLQRPFKDSEVMVLVKEYMRLYEIFQELKQLARVNMDLIYLSINTKDVPDLKGDLDQVQELIHTLMNGIEIFKIETSNLEMTVAAEDALDCEKFGHHENLTEGIGGDYCEWSETENEYSTVQIEGSESKTSESQDSNVAKQVAATYVKPELCPLSEQELYKTCSRRTENFDLIQTDMTQSTLSGLDIISSSQDLGNYPFSNSQRKTQEDHLSSHQMEIRKPQQNNICHVTLKSRLELDQYLESLNDDEPCICKFCGKQLQNKQFLKKHVESQLKNKFHICTLCGKEFEKRRTFQEHLRSHEKRKYQCKLCDMEFLSPSELSTHTDCAHLILFHNSELCSFCGMTFKTKGGLKQHLKSHEEFDKIARQKCTVCDKEFRAKNIEKHMKWHESGQNLVCDVCGKVFHKRKSLKSHIKIQHILEHEECPTCGKKISPCHLKRHMRTHSGIKPYKCSMCPKSFSQSNDRNSHIIICHTKMYPYICSYCSKGFIYRSYLTFHERNHAKVGHSKIGHSKGAHFKCTLCEKQFWKQSSFALHISTFHSKELDHCPICNDDLTFTSSVDFESHLNNVHIMNEQLTCSICKKSFDDVDKYNRHRVSHAEQRLFKCIFCKKNYSNIIPFALHTLNSHSRDHKSCPLCNDDFIFTSSVEFESHLKNLHLKEKPFKCSTCGESFYSKSQYDNHRVLHKDKTAFQCKDCGIIFKTATGLRHHIVIKHTKEPLKMYGCHICGRQFNSKGNQLKHTATHAGLKPYKCDICGAFFSSVSTRKTHLWTHSKEKRYPCDKCEKGFNDKRNYTSHMKKSHPEVVITDHVSDQSGWENS